jgi:oligosaccharide repeat unit polymerase
MEGLLMRSCLPRDASHCNGFGLDRHPCPTYGCTMKWHPASLMIRTWLLCFALFLLLPFELTSRVMTFYGFFILILFIGAFCAGALLQSPVIAQRRAAYLVPPDFKVADRIIAAVALIAIAALLFDLRSGAGLDLAAAYEIRGERSVAFINGTQSGSSLAFQVGFLTAPIGYVAIAKEVIFYDRLRYGRLLLFGFGPLLASALALGGRGPLLFAIVMFVLAMIVRRAAVAERPANQKRKLSSGQIVAGLFITVLGLAAMNYFVQVFVLRAGGAEATAMALDIVGDVWGINFSGPVATAMVNTLGSGNTYLIFVFAWYLIQGMVISNEVFTSYSGPSMLSLYGIEVLLAVARRFNLQVIVDGFTALNEINAFGFVTSAFGTLYVDYWFFGLPVAALWGSLTALVYRKSRTSMDARWFLAVPFIIEGILFSLINTPLGLTNGFTTHFWMLVVFLVAKPKRVPVATPHPASPATHLAPLAEFA